jgi:hypothetical protein
LKGKFQEQSARLWRVANPNLLSAKRSALVSELMKACNAVRLANDRAAEAAADRAVDAIKKR